jgi:hypothetical protein
MKTTQQNRNVKPCGEAALIDSCPAFQQTVAIFRVTVLVGRFWQNYIGQGVGGTSDVMEFICGTEEWAAVQ